VEICDSGERALQRLPDITPDLVLLDVMMPGTDGPTTLQRMRADPRFANIPVVFVTAKAMPAEVARFRELGAVAVIAKPFDPMQLGQQIATIWEGLEHGRA
jgi:CheY-like chemotaxis protein